MARYIQSTFRSRVNNIPLLPALRIVLKLSQLSGRAAARNMATEQIQKEYYESSKLAKYTFEPYWPEKKLRICITGGEMPSSQRHAVFVRLATGFSVHIETGHAYMCVLLTPMSFKLDNLLFCVMYFVGFNSSIVPCRAVRPLAEPPGHSLRPTQRWAAAGVCHLNADVCEHHVDMEAELICFSMQLEGSLLPTWPNG